MQHPLVVLDLNQFILGSARGPLASMHAMDVMWVSFYSIASMILSMLMVIATRKWITNSLLSFLVRMIAFVIFAFGTILMLLVVLTWPA